MVLAGALLGAAVAALVILYLTQPVFREFALSAARFFVELRHSDESRLSISLKNLLLSRPFYLQLLALLLLLAGLALALLDQNLFRPGQRIGVWVVVDRSGSMSVADGGGTRLDAATLGVAALMAQLDALPQEVDLCVSVYAMDMTLELLADDVAPAAAPAALRGLTARPLGNDLSRLVGAIPTAGAAGAEAENAPGCAPTHLVVFSDLPAPERLMNGEMPVIWLPVGAPADNVGLLAVQRDQGLAPGSGQGLLAQVGGYGAGVPGAALVVTDAAGGEVAREPVTAAGGEIQFISVPVAASGFYTVTITPGGAYAYDDRAVAAFDAGDTLRVAWELPDRSLADSLGWQVDAGSKSLRVAEYTASAAITPTVPTLLVGMGYGQATGAPIAFFAEGHPLLEDLNFDVAESLNLTGPARPLPAWLMPVMTDDAGATWFAASEDASGQPLVAYVPGLPAAAGDPNSCAFSATAFFNAVRYLLQVKAPPPACELTSPDTPEPDATHCALHPGESDTTIVGPGAGSPADLAPTSGTRTRERFGPWLVLAALAVFLIERGLGAFGGAAWR